MPSLGLKVCGPDIRADATPPAAARMQPEMTRAGIRRSIVDMAVSLFGPGMTKGAPKGPRTGFGTCPLVEGAMQPVQRHCHKNHKSTDKLRQWRGSRSGRTIFRLA